MAPTPVQTRDIRILAFLRGISWLGDGIALVTLYLRMSHHGGTWFVASLAIAVALPNIVFSPWAGFVVDNYPAKRLLMSLGVMEALVCVGLSCTTNNYATLALMFVLNIGVAFSLPGFGALVPTLAGLDNVNWANSLLQSVQGLGQVAGPALGGVFVGLFGQRWPLVIDAISFFVAALLVLALSSDRSPSAHHEPAKRGERDLGAGFRMLYQDKVLFSVEVATATFILSLGMINVAEVFFTTRALHATSLEYGCVATAFGVGMIGGSLLAKNISQDQRSLVRWSMGTIVGIGFVFGVIGLVTSMVMMYPLMVLGGLLVGLVNVSYNTLFMVRTPEESRGRMTAAAGAIFTSGELGATALGGIVLSLVAPRTVFQLAGICSVAAVLLLGPSALRAVRRDAL